MAVFLLPLVEELKSAKDEVVADNKTEKYNFNTHKPLIRCEVLVQYMWFWGAWLNFGRQ